MIRYKALSTFCIWATTGQVLHKIAKHPVHPVHRNFPTCRLPTKKPRLWLAGALIRPKSGVKLACQEIYERAKAFIAPGPTVAPISAVTPPPDDTCPSPAEAAYFDDVNSGLTFIGTRFEIVTHQKQRYKPSRGSWSSVSV